MTIQKSKLAVLDQQVLENLLKHYGIIAAHVNRDLSSLNTHIWHDEVGGIGINVEWHVNSEPVLEVVQMQASEYVSYTLRLSESTPDTVQAIIEAIKSGNYTFENASLHHRQHVYFKDIQVNIYSEQA